MIAPHPDSLGARLREFNPCHDEHDGRFTFKGEGQCESGPSKAEDAEGAYRRPPAIKAKTVDEAVALILQGKVVELAETRQVHTVLSKLAQMALDAKARGEAAPIYDLCKVSVAGTNLFCAGGLRTRRFPQGVPRVEMPQLGGEPVPGSPAAKLPKDANGEINAADKFIDYLKSLGIAVTQERVPAARLRASQSELVGPKVAGMMTAKGYDPSKKPIFASRDDYVVDGHHRWAATVGRDAADGRLGDSTMPIYRVHAPISEILHLANKWTRKFGIKVKAAGKGAKVT